MTWLGSDPLGAAWDLARDALLLGWAATALFCGVTGVAIALWAGLRWWVGLLLGVAALYAGLVLLLILGGVRAAERVRQARAARPVVTARPMGTTGGQVTPVTPGPAPAPGLRGRVRQGWRWWTRTPPTRTEVTVAVLTVVVAIGLVVATQVTWLTLSAAGHGVTGVGPFAIQLGLFVVLSAVAAVVCAAGVLRRPSAWWPVLLAWFGAWWLFVACEVLRARGALRALNRLLRDQVRERIGYDARPQIDLGAGWTVMLALAVAMLVLAVVLLVLQGRRGPHYRLVARS